MKTPYLIQRCSLTGKSFSMDLKTGEYWSMDYMGSSEFEFGAIPKFQRDIAAKIDKMVTISSEITLNGKTAKLYALVDRGDEGAYDKFLIALVNGDVHLKERSAVTQSLFDPKSFDHEICFWMDLDNNFVFTKDKEQLALFRATVKNSVKFMDAQKDKK